MYHHFNLIAKALTAYGVAEVELKDGQKANWREQVAKKLIDLQDKDGLWQNNPSGRWFEKDSVLTTYVLDALELIDREL